MSLDSKKAELASLKDKSIPELIAIINSTTDEEVMEQAAGWLCDAYQDRELDTHLETGWCLNGEAQ